MPNKVVQDLIDKTLRELSQTSKPIERSRVSNTPNGYIFLVAWSNASLLRVLIREYTNTLPKLEYRLKAQLDDAARSTVANIEEGFARQTTSEYINFLGYSRASLVEVKGDIQRSYQDEFLKSIPGSNLKDLEIDLVKWHEALKKSVISRPDDFRGNYRNLKESSQPFKFLYNPVDSIKTEDLTYEILIELINKTD
ncbi:MAG TPA: four helix bundle protein [Patescibacteria group bacterium]|nr:four helix bundle protein [Patescibacteria group bacterium]